MTDHCADCGCIMDRGSCTNCNEEVFIADQYADLGEPVPATILGKCTDTAISQKEYKQL